MNKKIDFILKGENEEYITKTCELEENDIVEWIVRITKNENAKIQLSFKAKDGSPGSVYKFVNNLVIDGLMNLNQIDRIIYTDGNNENVFYLEDIANITNLNSTLKLATDIELLRLKSYPSFLVRTTESGEN